ncbi:MAG: hypothetical protein IH989_01010 [Planctomycetes bacterium]|nr:hypothetical protein [Planctomycetota bacterium]
MHILVAVAILVPLLLGQTGGGSTSSFSARSAMDTPSERQSITFRVLGMMKTKSGAT